VSLHLIRRIACTAIPLTVAVIGLTAGTASALPRSGYCGELHSQASDDFSEAESWDRLANIDNNAGRYDQADAEFMLRDDAIRAWHGDVAMIVAYGC
jgi:hypothetical protein